MQKDEFKSLIDDIFANRDELYASFDKFIKTDGKFDLNLCEDEKIKEIYKKFYKYDYAVRKILPSVYKKFDIDV